MRATEFLLGLWGRKPPGQLHMWVRDGKKSHYPLSAHGADIIAYQGRPDVYTGVSLTHKNHGAHKRPLNEHAVAVAGLWLDLDVDGGPDNKTGAAPDRDRAYRLAHQVATPTVIIDSGYGLHAWYLLTEPWRFLTLDDQHQAATASAQWYQLHRTIAQADGWTVDHTHDLARLLRLPGTSNGKGGLNAPVDVLEASKIRHDRATLLQLADQAGPVDLGHAARPGQPTTVITPRDGARPPVVKLEALAFNNPDFADALQHAGNPGWSQSEWDLSLASHAAQAGWEAQEIADLIVWDRTRHGVNVAKAGRTKYVQRTVDKVTAARAA